MQVKNKTAIVTGASSGIGLATAKLLTEKGAKIALVSRNLLKLQKISETLKDSFAVVADMRKIDDIKRMTEQVKARYGSIDILINNAGQGYDAPIEIIDIETFHEIFDLDVVGPLAAMQQVIPIMRKQGSGAIINISSGTALLYLPNMAAYSSLKRALAGMSLTAREELNADNISVSVIYPYITATNFDRNTIKYGIKQEDTQDDEPPFPEDSAEYVAEKILEAITSGKAEIFAHDWMKPKS